MSPNQDAGIRRAPEPAAAALSDAQLLILIAQKDRDAFDAFFERHHRHAYNLAFRITHSASHAEEAVQEALVRVWKHADGFRPEGPPQSWFLRIVARESGRRLRKGRRFESVDSVGVHSSSAVASGGLLQERGRNEELDRLRLALGRLPQMDQRILALYFGAQMSQQEVGRTLGLSQRTVSRKVTLLVEGLRRRLAAAGARPESLAQVGGLLGVLLASGATPAPQALEALRSRLDASAPLGGSDGPRPSLGAPLLQPLVLGAGVVLAALVVLAMVEGPGSSGTPEEGMVAGEASPLSDGRPLQAWPPGPAYTLPLGCQRWSFEDGDLEAILPRYGTWDWGRGTLSGRGYLLAAPEALLLLPVRIPAAPFELLVRYRVHGPALRCGLNLNWVSGGQGLPCRLISPGTAMGSGGNLLRSARFVGLGRHICGSYGGGIDYLFEYEHPYPSEQLALALHDCAIAELVLRPLPEEESQALAGKIRAFLARGGLGRKVLTDFRMGESGGRLVRRGTSPLLVEEGRP